MNVHSVSKLHQLQEAATVQANQRGIHDTSMALIAQRAQIAVGTIYQFYPSKEALYTELLQSYYEALDDLPGEEFEGDFTEKLLLYFRNIKSYLKEDFDSFG